MTWGRSLALLSMWVTDFILRSLPLKSYMSKSSYAVRAIIVPRYLIKPRLEGRESAKRTTFAVVPECVWFLTAKK